MTTRRDLTAMGVLAVLFAAVPQQAHTQTTERSRTPEKLNHEKLGDKIRHKMRQVLGSYVGQFNDKQTRVRIAADIDHFVKHLQADGECHFAWVTCNEYTNREAVLDNDICVGCSFIIKSSENRYTQYVLSESYSGKYSTPLEIHVS